MQAIRARYLGPTSHRPARIVASTTSGLKLTMSRWKAEDITGELKTHDMEPLFRVVAQALADRMQWTGKLAGGQTGPDEYVYVFVV